MGLHSGSGDHENTVKTRKNGGMNFHLKEWPRPGPTKLTQAIPAEGSHRGSRLEQLDNRNRSNQESKFDFLATRQCLVKIDEGKSSAPTGNQIYEVPANQFSPSARKKSPFTSELLTLDIQFNI